LEIKRINNNKPVVNEDRRGIGNKKDFSQSFNFAQQKKDESQLKEMLENIKKKGNRLVLTKTYADVRSYKNLIKEYLKSVLDYMYTTKKDISFWQTQYFITTDIIDGKLEELTNLLLSEQKDNIKIASTIDEISGLVVDIYR
jgi:uncharacterized protein YaaR (DUF327 family)